MSERAVWNIRCEVDAGSERLPVTRVGLNFDINGIASATVMLPVGRNMLSGRPSEASGALLRLDDGDRATIYLEFIPLGSTGSAPDLGLGDGGKFAIFTGKITAKGAVVDAASGQNELSLQVRHILGDLTSSSCLSGDSHPTNPANFLFGALSGNPGGARVWSSVGAADKYIRIDTISNDLWGQAIQPWLSSVAEGNSLYIPEVGLRGASKNNGAIPALDALKPAAAPSAYVPSKLAIGVNEDTAELIRADISLLTASPGPLASQSFWDLIVQQIGPEYLLSIIPRATGGVVVPYIPGIRTQFKTITADTIEKYSLPIEVPSTLRAIGILSSSQLWGGSDLSFNGGQSAGTLGVGGWYEGRDKGMVQIRSGPRFLQKIIAPRRYSANSSGANQKPIRTTVSPDAAEPNDTKARMRDGLAGLKSVLDRYAKAIFAVENIRGRQAKIAGPIRLDIAPGSTVKFSVNDTLGDAVAFFGTVAGVSIAIDSESGSASTEFQLTHVRTEQENDSDTYALDSHPFYDKSFIGCTLVDLS